MMTMERIHSSSVIYKNRIEVALLTMIICTISYLLYFIIFPINRSTNISNDLIFITSWMGIFIALYIIFSWYKLTNMYFTPYTIFMMFYFFFNFGQPIMWAFGIHFPTEIGEKSLYGKLGVPTNTDILNGQIITLISALMFHFGAVICYKPKINKRKTKLNKVNTNTTLKILFITSIIIGLVAIPITLYDVYESLQVALVHGYKELYYSEFASSRSNFYSIVNMFFFPSLVGLLIGSRYNKKVMLFVYLVFFIYLLLNLLAGDRGSWVYKIIILIWLSHNFYKKINFKKLITYTAIAFVFLYIVDAIVSIRNMGLGTLTFGDFIENLSFENSPIISAIFEMGGSMSVVITLLMYGWDIWPYSNTYLLAILGMVTNQVIYTLDIPFSLISSWFSQEYLGISWGAGFSIVAEAVLNYGPYFAPLFMVVLGYIISSLIYMDKRINYTDKPLYIFFTVSTLHAILPVARGYFHLLLKSWFYGVFLYVLIIIIINNFIIKKSKVVINKKSI